MAKYFIVLFICITLGIAEANFPIEYSADAGNPVDATAIESPVDQGWNETATGDGVVAEGMVDVGVNSWRLLDNASNLGPKYSIALTAEDFQIMYDYGWEFTYVCKPTTAGGGWVGWGISSVNNPGWDIGSIDRVGFAVVLSGSGTVVINPQHGAAIDLGDYLPDVEVYMCPMSPGNPKDMQDLYENPVQVGDSCTQVSYNLFWGGFEFPSINFKGPSGNDSEKKVSRLMMSDVMSFWGNDEL